MAETPVPNMEPLEGELRDITPIPRYSPYVSNWWTLSTIDRIPETSVGWMLAQGWKITSSYAEEDCGQTFYAMSREGMNSWMILQSLLNEYTLAYNEGRAHNSIRYNDVVAMWVDAIERARHHLDTTGDISDGHVSIYVTQMDEMIASVESEMALALTDMTDAGTALAAQMALYISKLNELESIYDTHEATAEAFLTDLGVTELARINEAFDTTLAKNLQALTDRGMSSSAIVTAITARVERERSEAITNLNDRLNREKLENEHTLYLQEVALKGMVLDGRVKYNSALMNKAQFMVETRKQLALVIMQARMVRLSGRMEIRDKAEKLMLTQLDVHNNLAVGLWGFVERRSDEYPGMEAITQLVAGLGDSGGGWVQP